MRILPFLLATYLLIPSSDVPSRNAAPLPAASAVVVGRDIMSYFGNHIDTENCKNCASYQFSDPEYHYQPFISHRYEYAYAMRDSAGPAERLWGITDGQSVLEHGPYASDDESSQVVRWKCCEQNSELLGNVWRNCDDAPGCHTNFAAQSCLTYHGGCSGIIYYDDEFYDLDVAAASTPKVELKLRIILEEHSAKISGNTIEFRTCGGTVAATRTITPGLRSIIGRVAPELLKSSVTVPSSMATNTVSIH